jgi:uncharacterized membrane protein
MPLAFQVALEATFERVGQNHLSKRHIAHAFLLMLPKIDTGRRKLLKNRDRKMLNKRGFGMVTALH